MNQNPEIRNPQKVNLYLVGNLGNLVESVSELAGFSLASLQNNPNKGGEPNRDEMFELFAAKHRLPITGLNTSADPGGSAVCIGGLEVVKPPI